MATVSQRMKILKSVQAKIRTLDLTAQDGELVQDIQNASVVIQKVERVTGIELPGVVLSCARQRSLSRSAGTNERDDKGYPVVVQIVDVDNDEVLLGLDSYSFWEEQITKKFQHQPLDDVDDVYTCFVQDMSFIDQKKWSRDSRMVSGLILYFMTREDRVTT